MRILIAEDDPMIGDAMWRGLLATGFSVDWVKNGNAAEIALKTNPYQAMVLDLSLPIKDGLDVLRTLRRHGNDLPVIIVTARGSVAEKIAGLNAGADDYIAKPFELDELIARLHVQIRRGSGHPISVLECGALRLDMISKEVTVGGQAVKLSAKELALFEILMLQPGAVLSREKLGEKLFSWGDEPSSNTLEVHLHNLRKKLGAHHIRNVRGVGYKVVG